MRKALIGRKPLRNLMMLQWGRNLTVAEGTERLVRAIEQGWRFNGAAT